MSWVVRTTSHLFSFFFISENCFVLSYWLPWKTMTRRDGHHRFNWVTQLLSVTDGATTRNDGQLLFWILFWSFFRYPNIEMTCRVLPKPNSSARIPLVPFLWWSINQLRPSIWYGFIEPLMNGGVETNKRAFVAQLLVASRRVTEWVTTDAASEAVAVELSFFWWLKRRR